MARLSNRSSCFYYCHWSCCSCRPHQHHFPSSFLFTIVILLLLVLMVVVMVVVLMGVVVLVAEAATAAAAVVVEIAVLLMVLSVRTSARSVDCYVWAICHFTSLPYQLSVHLSIRVVVGTFSSHSYRSFSRINR